MCRKKCAANPVSGTEACLAPATGGLLKTDACGRGEPRGTHASHVPCPSRTVPTRDQGSCTYPYHEVLCTPHDPCLDERYACREYTACCTPPNHALPGRTLVCMLVRANCSTATELRTVAAASSATTPMHGMGVVLPTTGMPSTTPAYDPAQVVFQYVGEGTCRDDALRHTHRYVNGNGNATWCRDQCRQIRACAAYMHRPTNGDCVAYGTGLTEAATPLGWRYYGGSVISHLPHLAFLLI